MKSYDDEFTSLRQAVHEAEAHYESGRLPQALELYRTTVFTRLVSVAGRRSDWDAADALVIERLADLAILDGSLAAAQDLLTGLRDLYLNKGNTFAADYVAIKLAHLALENDDVTCAHARLREMSNVVGDLDTINLSPRGLLLWEGGVTWPGQDADSREAQLTRLYLVMGGILAAYGQFRDSVACFERGESLARNSKTPSVVQVCTPLRLSLATSHLALGEFAVCQDWLVRAATAKISSDNPAYRIRTQEIRADIAVLEGRYGEALETFSALLSHNIRLGFGRPVANSALTFAKLLILLNRTQDALEHIAAAESAAGEDALLMARAEVLRGLAYARRKSLAEEVAITPSVTEMWSGRRPVTSSVSMQSISRTDPLELPVRADFLAFFEDRALAVQWRLNNACFSDASQLMETLRSTFLVSDSPLIHSRIKALQGMVDYYCRDYSQAASKLSEAADELERLGLLAESWQTKRIWSWCLSRLGASTQAIARLDAKVQEDLAKLALSLDSVDRASFLLNKWTASEEYLLGRINTLVAIAKSAQIRHWWQRLGARLAIMTELNSLLERLEYYKLDSSAQFLGTAERKADTVPITKPPSLWRRILLHPLRSVSLHFLVLPDRVLLVQQGWLRLGFGVSPVSREELRELVSTWYRVANRIGRVRDLGVGQRKEAIREIEHTRRQALDRLAVALQLSALLKTLPKRVRELRIGPDDSLLGFPFAVLEHDGAALPTRFAIRLASPQSARSRSPWKRARQALLVGVSQGSNTIPPIPPLPNVKQELDTVHTWFKNRGLAVEYLMNGYADKTGVMQALTHSHLVHLACHGIFRTDKPGETGFILIPDPNHVQVLSLSELAGLNLCHLEHATLSACWAADRFVLPGRQTIGLPETFLQCGAHSVLACLWPINDFVAARFFERFYSYLEQYSRAEALRRTQLDCMQGQLPQTKDHGIDTSSAFYWAGFNLYGEDGFI
jgi:CHAT domain-containing protein/tetratricopeptide (TPR) repeat protein